MADKLCNETCGCPVPCAGGVDCRCRSGGVGGGGGESGGGIRQGAAHSLCSCGEHCSCNPCTCGRSEARSVVGRAACTCGSGCACSACGGRS